VTDRLSRAAAQPRARAAAHPCCDARIAAVRRRAAIPSILAVFALGLAACGDDDEAAGPAGTTVPTATATATATAGRPAAEPKATPGARSKKTHRCGQVDVKRANGSESGVTDIRASGLSCKAAKKFLRKQIKSGGKKPKGWKRTKQGNRLVFTKGSQTVSGVPAGGGF